MDTITMVIMTEMSNLVIGQMEVLSITYGEFISSFKTIQNSDLWTETIDPVYFWYIIQMQLSTNVNACRLGESQFHHRFYKGLLFYTINRSFENNFSRMYHTVCASRLMRRLVDTTSGTLLFIAFFTELSVTNIKMYLAIVFIFMRMISTVQCFQKCSCVCKYPRQLCDFVM